MKHRNASLNGHHEPSAGLLYDSSNIINVSPEGRIASIIAGSLIAGAGLRKIDRRPLSGLLKLAMGGYLLYRGISGNCPLSALANSHWADHHAGSVNIRRTLTIYKPRQEVYSFWRQLGNLPLFMQHLERVTELDSRHSRWVAKGPGGIGNIEWEAEIVKEEPGKLLGWRSVAGSMIATAGRINFKDTLNGSTQIEVMITYRPPAGYVGTSLAWLLNPAFEQMVEKDIARFKQFLETGETTTEEK